MPLDEPISVSKNVESSIDLISMETAIESLGLSRAQIYGEIKNENLKSFKVDDQQFFEAGEVSRFQSQILAKRSKIRKSIEEWLDHFATRLALHHALFIQIDPDSSDDDLAQELANRIVLDVVKSDVEDLYLDPVYEGDRFLVRSSGNLSEIGIISSDVMGLLRPKLKTLFGIGDLEDTGSTVNTFEKVIEGIHHQMRASVTQTLLGEQIHLRPFGRTDAKSLKQLGLDQQQIDVIGRLLLQRPGLVLFAGPSGDFADQIRLALAGAMEPANRVVVSLEHRVQYRNELLVQLDVGPPNGPEFKHVWQTAMGMSPDGLVFDDVVDGLEAKSLIEAVVAGVPVIGQIRVGGILGPLRSIALFDIDRDQLATSITGIIEYRLFRKYVARSGNKVRATDAEADLLRIEHGTEIPDQDDLDYSGQFAIFGIALADQSFRTLIRQEEPDWASVREWSESQPLSLSSSVRAAVLDGQVKFADAMQYLD